MCTVVNTNLVGDLWARGKCVSPRPDYIYDEACLDIYNHFADEVLIYAQYAECEKCGLLLVHSLSGKNGTSLCINTKFPIQMQFMHNQSVLCPWEHHMLEHYRYGWNLDESCSPVYIKEESSNAYIPIFVAGIIIALIGILWYLAQWIYKRTKEKHIWQFPWCKLFQSTKIETVNIRDTKDSPHHLSGPTDLEKHPTRMKSIDVFRGFCVLMMIFVNYGGGQYRMFAHSQWNGLTIADVLFPWFSWIMGVSMHLAFTSKLLRATPRKQLSAQIMQRSLILCVLGVAYSSYPYAETLSKMRLLGVLQRLGLCYLIVGLLEATCSRLAPPKAERRVLSELTTAWSEWLVIISFVLLHTCITFFVDAPDCGKGYLGPGGMHDYGKHALCPGGIAGHIDRLLFGERVRYRSSCYGTTVGIESCGILGTLTGAFLVFLGVHAGRILTIYSHTQDRVIRLITYGFIFCLLGGSLCNFSKNGGYIPINFRLNSLSFVCVLGGLGFPILALLHVIVDVLRIWDGKPFVYPGMNPLLLYICHRLFSKVFPFWWTPSSSTHAAYLGINLWGTFLLLCLSIYLYKKNIFISV